MKTKFLFPVHFVKIGWFFIVIAVILILLRELPFFDVKTFAIINSNFFGKTNYMKVINDNIQFELSATLLIIGLLFVAFSRLKNEDEFISRLRLESLLWATYINYTLLFLSMWFVYGIAFLYIMIYNMFTILIMFIIRFRFVLWKSLKSNQE